MTEDLNVSRRLAPDTKWILGAMGTGLVVLVGVTQYQIDRAAELTLERARSSLVSTTELVEAFRPRDSKIAALETSVTVLREERAKVGQALQSLDATMARIVDVSIQTQARAAQTEGQLTQLLKQTETNASLASQIVDRNQVSFNAMAERLARLEANQASRSGTP